MAVLEINTELGWRDRFEGVGLGLAEGVGGVEWHRYIWWIEYNTLARHELQFPLYAPFPA